MTYAVKVGPTNNKGRGVFATKPFLPGEIIEVCPVIPFTASDAKICQQTILDGYLYDWDELEKACLPLGYGLIYNHSFTPNATYEFDTPNQTMTYRAYLPIQPDTEITVNYNFVPDDNTPLDFIDVHSRKKIVVEP